MADFMGDKVKIMNKKYLLMFTVVILIIFGPQFVSAQDSNEVDLVRKRMVEKMDRKGLRFNNKAVIVETDELIRIPKSVVHFKNKITIAKTKPVIEFCVIPNEERYQANPPSEFHPTIWSSWGQGNFSELTQTYYAAFGNHRLHQSRLYIAEYDSKTKSMQLTTEVNQILGNRELPNGYGEGKIHGWLDFYNGTDLYYFTYYAHYPEPLDEHYLAGYDGSHFMSYNIVTKKFTDFGVPMPRATWPFHRMDTKRGLMYGVGFYKQFLCYDIKEEKTRFAGFPQDGIMWNNRIMIIDDKTGFVYSSNTSEYDKDIHFVQYNPVTNKFKKMSATVPPNEEDGIKRQIRASTEKRLKDGSFICVTKYDSAGPGGQLFKYFPDEDKVETMSLCWPGEQRYTTSMALSPGEKYLYYLPGAHGKSYLEGCPVVQYNIKTGERKVLAFLFSHFYDEYGYVPGGSFSINLDKKGERLFICMNGQFIKYEEINADIFGDPSIMVVHIPESERR